MSDWRQKRGAGQKRLRDMNAAFGSPSERMKAMYGDRDRDNENGLDNSAIDGTHNDRPVPDDGQRERRLNGD